MGWPNVTAIGIGCATFVCAICLVTRCTVEQGRSLRQASLEQARIEAAEKHQFRQDLLASKGAGQ